MADEFVKSFVDSIDLSDSLDLEDDPVFDKHKKNVASWLKSKTNDDIILDDWDDLTGIY